MLFVRRQKFHRLGGHSCFFWGPRQTGKSTLLSQLFPSSPNFDLLDARQFDRFSTEPYLFQEEVAALPKSEHPIIVDEIQKIPRLLDIVQFLMTKQKRQFILCGSSARKLKRGGGNLLGGRALRYELFPLTSAEIPDFDLLRALNRGLLPAHYLSESYKELTTSYVGDYLKEEIRAEALTRNLQAFGQFLRAAAFCNGEILSFTNIASECGVKSPTIKNYFEILVDTLLGQYVESFRLRPKRRIIKAPKFYFFDVGIVNALLKRHAIELGSELFGRAFEHFIYQELVAHCHYTGLNYPITYWHTESDHEVDFILGDHEVAIEVKGTRTVQSKHLNSLHKFREDYVTRRSMVVSLDAAPRKTESGISIVPWKNFLDALWSGGIIT